jgi:hypothetical protein
VSPAPLAQGGLPTVRLTRSPVSPRGAGAVASGARPDICWSPASGPLVTDPVPAGAVTPSTDAIGATTRWITPAAVPPDLVLVAGRGCVTPASAPLTQPAVEPRVGLGASAAARGEGYAGQAAGGGCEAGREQGRHPEYKA